MTEAENSVDLAYLDELDPTEALWYVCEHLGLVDSLYGAEFTRAMSERRERWAEAAMALQDYWSRRG